MGTETRKLTGRITIRLNEEEELAAWKLAKRKGLHKISSVLRMALAEYLYAEGYLKDSEQPEQKPPEKIRPEKTSRAA